MKITLIQPQYPYGGADKRQIYLPGGLMNVGSRLIHCGLDVGFIDLNMCSWDLAKESLIQSDIIGFTVLGPPYIPVVISLIRNLREKGFTQPILVGGEGVVRIRQDHFGKWFAGLDVTQIKNDLDIAMACGIKPNDLRSAYTTSMVPMLKQLDKSQLDKYLTTEFSLFLSQGCAFNCAFCSAAKGRKEEYRDVESLTDEVRFICDHLKSIGHGVLQVYVTNLDGFQTSDKFEDCLRVIYSIAQPYQITPSIRCLATSRCTFRACQADPELPRRLRSFGLTIVAFGADGADEETWRRQNKSHNSLSELDMVCRAMKDTEITTELLMVIGFQDDGMRALWRDLKYSLQQAVRGCIIRPYLAKSQTPSGRWQEGNSEVEAFVNDSELLLRLDYAMLGSVQTHPKFLQRTLVNIVYLLTIAVLAPLGRCATRPLVPVPKGIWRFPAMFINQIMPFDR